MKFLVDANLPYKLVEYLRIKGFDVIHTDDLPSKERTTDREIRRISVEQQRIIISKDSDFLDSHLLLGVPYKLFLITTGNITNRELIVLIEKDFELVIELIENYDLIELNNERITVHEK